MQFRCRSAMLALACLAATFPESAVAQQDMRTFRTLEEAKRAPLMVPWTDSADAAALKECREKITQPSSTTKVGPLVPLRNAFILRHHGNRRASSYPPVPQDKVRSEEHTSELQSL